MKTAKLWVWAFMLVSGTSWGYGSSGGTTACAKPVFTEFAPAEHAEVPANSEFSFTASKNTHPASIKVSVKDVPVTVQITPENNGSLHVQGHLPPELKNTYARIAITANGQNTCPGGAGWLVKITDAAQ